MFDYDVDIVVPFVDNTDPVWKRNSIEWCKKHYYTNRVNSFSGERYDNPGLFEYCLKCIDRFMPWVRKIHLIVANIEQVPSYINKEKTHIVLHSDIIPSKFLPTWNSTTIEMYIHNIEGLAEHFIYFNDDMYPVMPLNKEDFFTEDDKIRISWHKETRVAGDFRQVCKNNFTTVATIFNKSHDRIHYLRPFHSATPMITSHCRACFAEVRPTVEKWISPFRTSMQHNQYIYPIYEELMLGTAEQRVPFKYISLKKTEEEVCQVILNELEEKHQMICINDVNKDKIVNYDKIKAAFKKLLE